MRLAACTRFHRVQTRMAVGKHLRNSPFLLLVRCVRVSQERHAETQRISAIQLHLLDHGPMNSRSSVWCPPFSPRPRRFGAALWSTSRHNLLLLLSRTHSAAWGAAAAPTLPLPPSKFKPPPGRLSLIAERAGAGGRGGVVRAHGLEDRQK